MYVCCVLDGNIYKKLFAMKTYKEMKAFFKLDTREMLVVSCLYQSLYPRGVPYVH